MIRGLCRELGVCVVKFGSLCRELGGLCRDSGVCVVKFGSLCHESGVCVVSRGFVVAQTSHRRTHFPHSLTALGTHFADRGGSLDWGSGWGH